MSYASRECAGAPPHSAVLTSRYATSPTTAIGSETGRADRPGIAGRVTVSRVDVDGEVQQRQRESVRRIQADHGDGPVHRLAGHADPPVDEYSRHASSDGRAGPRLPEPPVNFPRGAREPARWRRSMAIRKGGSGEDEPYWIV
jgi:hypothetical protein